MKLYIVQAQELSKQFPTIATFNLKSDGLYIGRPGTIIFRTHDEAQAAIDRIHIAMAEEVARQREAEQNKEDKTDDQKRVTS